MGVVAPLVVVYFIYFMGFVLYIFVDCSLRFVTARFEGSVVVTSRP